MSDLMGSPFDHERMPWPDYGPISKDQSARIIRKMASSQDTNLRRFSELASVIISPTRAVRGWQPLNALQEEFDSWFDQHGLVDGLDHGSILDPEIYGIPRVYHAAYDRFMEEAATLARDAEQDQAQPRVAVASAVANESLDESHLEELARLLASITAAPQEAHVSQSVPPQRGGSSGSTPVRSNAYGVTENLRSDRHRQIVERTRAFRQSVESLRGGAAAVAEFWTIPESLEATMESTCERTTQRLQQNIQSIFDDQQRQLAAREEQLDETARISAEKRRSLEQKALCLTERARHQTDLQQQLEQTAHRLAEQERQQAGIEVHQADVSRQQASTAISLANRFQIAQDQIDEVLANDVEHLTDVESLVEDYDQLIWKNQRLSVAFMTVFSKMIGNLGLALYSLPHGDVRTREMMLQSFRATQREFDESLSDMPDLKAAMEQMIAAVDQSHGISTPQ